jgi:hypothetical protein
MTASSIFLIALFVLIIVLLTCVSSSPPAAYYANRIFKKYSNIESFGNGMLNGAQMNENASTAAAIKLNGFGGLFGSPDQHKPFDKFVETKGDRDCKTPSYGLTNSMGGLCLSAEQIELLRSRGGNMTMVRDSMNEV